MCVHGHATRSSPAPRVSSVSSVAIHSSRHLRGLTTWCYLPHRGSRGRRRAEVRGRRWTKLRGARGTVEYVSESNSVPPHPPLSHLAPCDVGLYRVPPPLCVWARPCVRPPLLIAVCVVQGVITSLCGPVFACGRGHRLTGSAEQQRLGPIQRDEMI